MSLLTICQNTVNVLGFGAQPSSIVGSSDSLARQMLALLNTQCIKHVTKRHPWQALVSLHTITTTASDDSYALPADFDRYISNTFWDTTNYRQMHGSIDPQTWRYLKHSVIASSSLHRQLRIYNDEVLVYPTPTVSNETLVAEYVTSKPCESSDGLAAKTKFESDTDVFKLDERLLELQLEWRLLKAKGLDYAEAYNDAERALELAIAQDAPSITINLGRGTGNQWFPNIPPTIDA